MAVSTRTTSSTSSSTGGHSFNGKLYATYQEMADAKRAHRSNWVKENISEPMASMRREEAAAAAAKKRSRKATKKNKSNRKCEEVGVSAREYPLRNRTTTPVRLSQEAAAELVQKSKEIQNQKGTEVEGLVEKKKNQPKKKQRPKKKAGRTTVNSKGQVVTASISAAAKNRGPHGCFIDHIVRADNDGQLGQIMRTLVLDGRLWNINSWHGRIKNELTFIPPTRTYPKGRHEMVLGISEDPQEESKPISGFPFRFLSDIVDRCKIFNVSFGGSSSDHRQLNSKLSEAGFKRVKGPTLAECRGASKDVIDTFEYIYVHPMFDVNKPELIRKIVSSSLGSKWSYDSL